MAHSSRRIRVSNAFAGVGVLFLVLAGVSPGEGAPAILALGGLLLVAISHVLTPCEDQITKWWRERLKKHGLLMLCLCVASAAALAEPRQRFSGVSSVRIANYNSPSVLLEGRDQVRAIVEELNQLRRKDWVRGDARIACYSTVVLMSGKKRAGELRVTADRVVERPVEKGQTTWHLGISPADIPELTRRLAGILPAKDCS